MTLDSVVGVERDGDQTNVDQREFDRDPVFFRHHDCPLTLLPTARPPRIYTQFSLYIVAVHSGEVETQTVQLCSSTLAR